MRQEQGFNTKIPLSGEMINFCRTSGMGPLDEAPKTGFCMDPACIPRPSVHLEPELKSISSISSCQCGVIHVGRATEYLNGLESRDQNGAADLVDALS